MEKELVRQIIDSSLEVHRTLGGPGLLETVYESALCYELSLRGVKTKRQIAIPVTYKNISVRDPLYLDILVEDQLICEIKATGKDYPFYQVQLYTHLRLSGLKSGLLINFGKEKIMEGIRQIFNHSI